MRICLGRCANCSSKHEGSLENSQGFRVGPRRWKGSVSLNLSVAVMKKTETSSLRPEQLVLQDDPAFLPDFFLPTLDFDIPLIGSSTQGSSKRESDLSTQIHPSSQSSHKEAEGSFVDLAIPSSSGSGGAGGIGGFQLYDAGDDLHMDEPVIPDDILGEVGFDPNVGFNFDEIGNLQEMDPMHQTPARPSEVIVGRDVSESALRTRVGPELEPGAMDVSKDVNLK